LKHTVTMLNFIAGFLCFWLSVSGTQYLA
jgi:hypothetical protein